MKPPSKRRGFMNPKTVGRAFWIGLAVSLALHAILLSTGRFQIPRLGSAPTLEAKLESEAFKAVPLPEPKASEPIAPSKPQPQPKPRPQQDSSPPEPLPATPVVEAEPAVTAMAPAPPSPEAVPVIPLSKVEPPPLSEQPYSELTRAAQSIRQLPAHVEIVYELKGLLSGRQTHVWQRTGDRYTLQTIGKVTGLVGLFMRGTMIQKSSGRIGSLGLMPDQYEMQRLSGKKETLRFDYDANTIESIRTDKHGSRTLELPMLIGAQDPLSSIYQLAMAAQNDKDGFIVAAGTKRVKGYPYHTLGMETTYTALGETKALHVTRAGDSEKGSVHLWLAPSTYALPVKITYVDEDGSNWELEAVSITTR
jgi:hypothetical protein